MCPVPTGTSTADFAHLSFNDHLGKGSRAFAEVPSNYRREAPHVESPQHMYLYKIPAAVYTTV